MLIALAQWLQGLYPDQLGFLRVVQYITFRAVMAALTALLIGLAFGPWVINRLTNLKFGQPNLEVVCPLQDVNRIVTDKAPSREMALALRKAEIELNL